MDMRQAQYQQRRGQIEDYFDRTAVKAWEQLTSTAPVGRIRATVRAGRDRMRATLLDWLPADLHGARLSTKTHFKAWGAGRSYRCFHGHHLSAEGIDSLPQLRQHLA